MKDEGTYTARSQSSLLREHELRIQLAAAQAQVKSHQGKIAASEASKKYILNGLSRPGNHMGFQDSLRRTNDMLVDQRDQLAYAEAMCAELQAAIDDLKLSPAELKARGQNQAKLVSLTSERLEKDKQIAKAVDDLRRILAERAELSGKMAECASAIEFTASDDGLDTERFDQLLASLPNGFAASSEKWAAWFLGKREGLQTYVVRDAALVVAETLAHYGVHGQGDKIELLEHEARELLRENRPAPEAGAHWKVAAPSIVTLEAFAQAVAAAEGSERSVEDVWVHEDFEREMQRKEAFVPGAPGGEAPRRFSSITEAMHDEADSG